MHTLFIYSMLIWKLFVLTWILILSLLSAILFISKIRANAVAEILPLTWLRYVWSVCVFVWMENNSVVYNLLSLDFVLGGTIKIPQSLFFSLSLSLSPPQIQKNFSRWWWIEEVCGGRRFMGFDFYSFANLLLATCLFVCRKWMFLLLAHSETCIECREGKREIKHLIQ